MHTDIQTETQTHTYLPRTSLDSLTRVVGILYFGTTVFYNFGNIIIEVLRDLETFRILYIRTSTLYT